MFSALINLSFTEVHFLVLLLLLILGFSALIYGADILTSGASSISVNMRIDPLIVGLTVVSIATSMPEMATSIVAAKGSPGLAIGNIVGSNIANIGLILGLSAFFSPLNISKRMVRIEVPFLLFVSALFYFCSLGGGFSRLEGLFLIFLTLFYLIYIVKTAKISSKIGPKNILEKKSVTMKLRSTKFAIFFVIAGTLLLAFGADTLVGTSVEIATRMGAGELLVGLTILAIGTSLPELAASIAAVRAGSSDMCTGNIVGSCLFNILLVGGGVSVVWGINIGDKPIFLELTAFLLLPCLLLWFFRSDYTVSRKEGIVLLISYAIIISLSAFGAYGYF